MKRFIVSIAVAAVAAMALSLPSLAADALPWPWKAKRPPDPALVELTHVDEVSVASDKSILSITVQAKAPGPGYTELQLVYRLGDPKDRIFAFDARGRAPQDAATPVITPVTIEASYSDAPMGNFDVIEVYSKENCVAYSVKDNKPAQCTGQVSPQ